ncbi:MAG TPA: amidase family protein [Acidimicrobiia bacterium]|nr:amidase family protein [Acidimicrobiia bacterium]
MTPSPVVPVDTVGAFMGAPQVLRGGAPDGPLAGTTIGVKDVFDFAGLVMGAGSPAFAADRPPAEHDAPAVESVVAAGTTVVGKTVCDELTWSLSGVNAHYGAPLNVAAPGRRAGGSSSGSAAAVAAGLVDLGLGTDCGGSIRVPSSQCGIFGWRPTHGAVPVDGVFPLAPSFDTVGLLARDPGLLRLGASALLDPGRGTAPVRGQLVGLGEAWGDTTDDVRAGLRALVPSGAPDLGVNLARAAGAFRTCQAFEVWRGHGHWFETTHPDLAPETAAHFEYASHVTADDVDRAREIGNEVAACVHGATAGGRVLAYPAAPGAAPPLELSEADAAAWRARAMQLTCLAGFAGAPVVVVPLLHDDGLPVGAALVGAPDTDLALLALAATLV